LKQFLLRFLTHKLPLDEYIVLAMPDKAFHLNLSWGTSANVRYHMNDSLQSLPLVGTTAISWSTRAFKPQAFLPPRWTALQGLRRKLHGESLLGLTLTLTTHLLLDYQHVARDETPDHRICSLTSRFERNKHPSSHWCSPSSC
jgi:hypothetical protein